MRRNASSGAARIAHPGYGGNLNLLTELAHAPSRVVSTLLEWQTRASQRAQLASLDERLVKDMGLTREQAAREAAKPFWRR